MLSGDIKTNSGPAPSYGKCFSIYHWNLNSITAHNLAKLSLLTAYNVLHSFDIICPSEMYLNSETPPNDTRLELPSYNLFHSDHPSNNKRGGVCVYYKSTIPLRILNISNLDECINFEISIAKKFCRFIHLIALPVKIDFLATKFAMSQVINQPTHILDNSKSCIDLIVTSQPNMIMDSGVHPSLHSNCHHQIIYAKFDLKVFYPPPYERAMWHFSRANSDQIKKAINLFD